MSLSSLRKKTKILKQKTRRNASQLATKQRRIDRGLNYKSANKGKAKVHKNASRQPKNGGHTYRNIGTPDQKNNFPEKEIPRSEGPGQPSGESGQNSGSAPDLRDQP